MNLEKEKALKTRLISSLVNKIEDQLELIVSLWPDDPEIIWVLFRDFWGSRENSTDIVDWVREAVSFYRNIDEKKG